MSMTLTRVRLKNFRTFTDVDVLIPTSGLTTVVGANGAGKSSLVSTAVFYALYGKAPAGVALKDLRRQGASESDPTEVIIDFIAHGKTVSVSRSMRGKNNTSMAEVTVDGEAVTDTKAGAATMLIEELVGTPEAFAAVHLVQQKSLDALVQARGADRRKLIERLSGVDRLQKAVDEARARAREAKAVLSGLVQTVDVDLAAVCVSDASERVRVVGEGVCAARVELSSAERAWMDARERVEEWERASRGALERRAEWARLDAAVMGAVDFASTAADAVAVAEKNLLPLPGEPGVVRDLSDMRERLTGLREEKAGLEAQLASLVGVSPEQVRGCLDVLGVTDSDRAVDEGPLNERISVLRAQIAQLSGQLAGLTDQCPTCGQSMNTERLRVEITENISASEIELEAAISDRDFAEMMNSLVAARDYLRPRLGFAEKAASERAAIQDALDTVQANGTALMGEISACEKHNQQVEIDREAYDQAAATHLALQAAEKAHADSLERVATAQAALDAFGGEPSLNAEAEEQARDAAKVAEELYNRARASLHEAERALTDAENEERAARKSLEEAEQHRAVRESSTNTARIAETTAQELAIFRENRLAALAPALAESASDYLSQLSAGRYPILELSEDFEPSVLDANTNRVRSASMLSGGEESLVALAIRMGLGDEIATTGPGSLLVLDEVLGAMDSDRQQLIVQALRGLDRQVVLVDHHGVQGDHTLIVEDGSVSISGTAGS